MNSAARSCGPDDPGPQTSREPLLAGACEADAEVLPMPAAAAHSISRGTIDRQHLRRSTAMAGPRTSLRPPVAGRSRSRIFSSVSSSIRSSPPLSIRTTRSFLGAADLLASPAPTSAASSGHDRSRTSGAHNYNAAASGTTRTASTTPLPVVPVSAAASSSLVDFCTSFDDLHNEEDFVRMAFLDAERREAATAGGGARMPMRAGRSWTWTSPSSSVAVRVEVDHESFGAGSSGTSMSSSSIDGRTVVSSVLAGGGRGSRPSRQEQASTVYARLNTKLQLIILRNHAWLLQFAALVCLGFFMAFFTVTVDLVVGWLFQKRKDLLSTAKLEILILGVEDGSGGFVDSRDHDHDADRAFLSYYNIHSVAQFLQLSPHAFNRAAWVLSCVVLTLTAFALVKANAPFGKGSGLPEVKNLLSCGTKRALSSDAQTLEFLSLETLSWKTVGLMLVLSAGLPIGKLGPYVHISCCATSVACKKLLSSTSRSGSSGRPSGALQGCVSSWLQANELRIMIAAVAAGVCATFGAPLGAVFFAIEMATTFFFVSHVWRAFCCSVSCLFALRVCGYLHVTRLFALTDLGEPPLEETPWFVLLGVLCGLIARAVISFTKRVFAFAKKLQETGAAVAEVHLPGNGGHEMTDSSPSGAGGPGRDGGDYRTSSSAEIGGGGRERTNNTFRRTLSRSSSCFSSLCSRCRTTFRSVVANWRIVLFVTIVSGVCASLVLVDSRLAVQDKDVINALFSKEPLFSSSSSSSTSNSEDQDQQRRSSESSSSTLLLLLIAQKSILFPLAAACPVPAGVFTPVFVLGAAVGRLFGEYLEYFVSATEQAKYDSAGGIIFDAGRLFGEAVVPLVGGTGTTGSPSAVQRIEPALYAVVGATCLTAGVTRMVSVILIVSELTGQVNHLLPMLLAVCAAIITASAAKNSIFDVIIHLRNMRFFPYLRDLRAYHELNARDVCRVVPESCYLHEGFSSGRLLQVLRTAVGVAGGEDVVDAVGGHVSTPEDVLRMDEWDEHDSQEDGGMDADGAAHGAPLLSDEPYVYSSSATRALKLNPGAGREELAKSCLPLPVVRVLTTHGNGESETETNKDAVAPGGGGEETATTTRSGSPLSSSSVSHVATDPGGAVFAQKRFNSKIMELEHEVVDDQAQAAELNPSNLLDESINRASVVSMSLVDFKKERVSRDENLHLEEVPAPGEAEVDGNDTTNTYELAGVYLPAEHVLDEAPLIVPENMSLARIHFLFLMLSLETLLVRLEGADGKENKVPLGIITRESFFTALETYHRLRG